MKHFGSVLSFIEKNVVEGKKYAKLKTNLSKPLILLALLNDVIKRLESNHSLLQKIKHF